MERSRRILMSIDKLEEAVQILDNCQAGDWRNQISPVKHALRDVLAPFVEQIRAIARQAWDDEGSEIAHRAVASWQLDDDYTATDSEFKKLEEHLNQGERDFPE